MQAAVIASPRDCRRVCSQCQCGVYWPCGFCLAQAASVEMTVTCCHWYRVRAIGTLARLSTSGPLVTEVEEMRPVHTSFGARGLERMILSFSHYTEKNGPSGRSNLGNESDSYFRVTERDCLR